MIAFCRGGEGKTKLCFGPDKRISPEYSRKICKGEKSTESCTYMNYVSGAFVRLGLCHETIIFRRIWRSRQHAFEDCNNGIMCCGDGRKCLYFPVYIYSHLLLCKFIQASPWHALFFPRVSQFSLFLLIPTAPVTLPQPGTPSVFPGLPSFSVRNSSLLSISFPVCSDALGRLGKCRIFPSGRW